MAELLSNLTNAVVSVMRSVPVSATLLLYVLIAPPM